MAEYHIGQKIWPKLGEVDINTELLNGIEGVIKLGITTIPGVKFNLNNATKNSNNQVATIEIGRTGFFELDLKGLGMIINSIKVDAEIIPDTDPIQYKHVNTINNNYCYIDFIYEDGGSGV